MKKLIAFLAVTVVAVASSQAQVLLSGGLSYSQDFDSLGNTPDNGSGTWNDNSTLLGWYTSRAFTVSTGTFGPYTYTGYRIGAGGSNNGSVWSFGTIGAADRALGSLGSGTVRSNVFGVRIQNDTASSVDTVTISYTGEQWRNGGNTAAQTLAFAYKVGSTPIVTSPMDMSAAGVNGWVGFSGLNFVTPTVGATTTALDGNNALNRTLFSGVVLTGVTLNPGDEIFLRWLDIDDSGNDHALAVDDFNVTFSVVPEPSAAIIAGLGILGVWIFRRNRK